METTVETARVRYDPYDAELDVDPYPTWRRLRDEAPLYYNEQYDFYALSRFADVKDACTDWDTYRSGRGTVLEVVRSNLPVPPGIILFEDPPEHDQHRALLARVFTPRRIAAIEPKIRAYCAAALEPMVERGGFDFITDLGAEVPMRTIGMMLGMAEADQVKYRQRVDDSFHATGDEDMKWVLTALDPETFSAYIDYRTQNPADDLMTDLLNATYTDSDGVDKHLNKQTILNYVGMLAAAGNETTVRLIGWAGKLLAEHPDQRRELVADPSLIPDAIEELLRYEAPSPVNARYLSRDVELYGVTVKRDSVMLLLNGSANRDERMFAEPDRFDIHRANKKNHLAFGHGIHFCLGAHLARLEARVALEEVLKRFPEWEVDWDNAVQAHTSTVRGWEKLPVVTD
jgi:cytochrome P450